MSLFVGQTVTIERTSPYGVLDHRREDHITKLTAKRAYVGTCWWALADETSTLRPRYLDYTTRVVALGAP